MASGGGAVGGASANGGGTARQRLGDDSMRW
jgi:hypothetical protein